MTAVGPAAFCSLPSGFRFTLILDQTDISDKFSSFLDAAIRRDSPILPGGELRDLFGPQVIWRPDDRAWPPGSISIPCIPCGQKLPVLDQATQAEIVENFQPKLLAFRFAYLAEARATNFDASKFALPLKELAVSFAAATPGEPDLQADLFRLLREESDEVDAANWVDLTTVIVEAILLYCREAKAEHVYVGAVAKMAEKILHGRGESRSIDAGAAGQRIKALGFSTERRDARGVKLLLSTGVCARVHELAHLLDVPGARECECRRM